MQHGRSDCRATDLRLLGYARCGQRYGVRARTRRTCDLAARGAVQVHCANRCRCESFWLLDSGVVIVDLAQEEGVLGLDADPVVDHKVGEFVTVD